MTEMQLAPVTTRVDVLFERDLLPSSGPAGSPNLGLVNAAELVNPTKVAARRFNMEGFQTLNDLAEVLYTCLEPRFSVPSLSSSPDRS